MKKVWIVLVLLLTSAAVSFAQKGKERDMPSAEQRVEKRIKRLDASLELSPQQKEILQKDMLRIERERDELRAATIDQRKQQRALREAEKELLKKTLNPEQQEKLKAQQQERAQQMKQRKALPDAPAQKQAE